MDINRITITQDDKYKTIVYPSYTTKEPLGSVVLLHGMAEHHERYEGFISFLNANGYDCFIYDHRGHGKDKKFEELGHFADNGGYRLVINDAIAVLKYVKANNRGSKLVLFGHSMGSIIARNVVQYYDEMDAAIFCGTANNPAGLCRLGLFLGSIIKKISGPHSYSHMMNSLVSDHKEFAKISDRTTFDWLTRDNYLVGLYINDPYCGYLCTSAFCYDLIKLTYLAGRPNLVKKTRRDLPILFISGSNDPVGAYGQGVSQIFALYQKLGFNNSDCTLYEECRHELLNELNKDAIMQDILTWMNEQLSK